MARELSYLEGWYAISEANRIFGFDGWSRETLETRCALSRETPRSFLAIYIARVRITVKARGATVIREGHGTAKAEGLPLPRCMILPSKPPRPMRPKEPWPPSADPLGLSSIAMAEPNYRRARRWRRQQHSPSLSLPDSGADSRSGFHPDDTTPIPRPSRYYGQRTGPSMLETMRKDQQAPPTAASTTSTGITAPPLAPEKHDLAPSKIDKSQLAIAEPKRLRDKAHLKFVASQPCLICGRQPSDPHHLRFAQPRAIGMKVSDEFTVPLCRGHHRQLHQAGDEVAWWERLHIDVLEIAKSLWEKTRSVMN